jgi:hypothetical protein
MRLQLPRCAGDSDLPHIGRSRTIASDDTASTNGASTRNTRLLNRVVHAEADCWYLQIERGLSTAAEMLLLLRPWCVPAYSSQRHSARAAAIQMPLASSKAPLAAIL